METHLSSDIDYEQRFSFQYRVPVHLVLSEECIRYEDCASVVGVYYKTLGDGGWERARYMAVLHEFVLEDYIQRAGDRMLGRATATSRPRSATDKRTRLRFALFTSFGMSYREGAVEPTDVVRLRLLCTQARALSRERAHRGVLSLPEQAFVGGGRDLSNGEFAVDVDFMQKDVLSSRQRAVAALKWNVDARPKAPEKNAAGGDSDRGRGAAGGLDTPEAIGSEETTFFSIDVTKKVQRPDACLASYMSALPAAVIRGGPLEDPSKVRGFNTTVRRGQILTEGEGSSDAAAKEPPSESASGKWFAHNPIFVSVLPDIKCQRNVYAVWYERSFWSRLRVKQKTSPYASIQAGLGRSFTDFAECLSALCRNTCAALEAALSSSRVLRQRFLCAISTNIDFEPIFDMLCVSKHVWVNQVDGSSCIIKALIENLRAADDGNRARYLGRGDAGADWHADVVDCVRGKVYCGIDVKLIVCPRTGLFKPCKRDGKPVDWLLDPALCTLYVHRDLSALWVVPGGFCAEFKIGLHGVQLDVIRERFKMC